MATVLSKSSLASTNLRSYCATLHKVQSIAIKLRLFSNFENNDGIDETTPSILKEESNSSWPDELMGPLNPTNKKFPLPGNVGVVQQHKLSTKSSIHTYIPPKDILESASNSDRQLTVMSQIIAESDILDEDYVATDDRNITDTIIREHLDKTTVELAIQDCPKILYKDFQSIFLGMPKSHITVITITQKTLNDMSGWSSSVEEEREKLLDEFIATATEICQLLKAHHFWCDFIDPSSGQAYFGPYTNSTLFETDDRYNHLGFRIEDLGCCKVITHKQWGTKVFVGCVVTTADKSHPVMQKLLQLSEK